MQLKYKTFQWSGYLKTGHYETGVLAALNIQMAKEILLQKDILLRHIRQQKKFFIKRMQSQNMLCMIKQLSALLDANLPLMSALELLGKTHEDPIKPVIESIQYDLKNANTLSYALRKHDGFDVLLCDLIEIGEQSGTLIKVLNKSIQYKESSLRFKRKIVKVLTYPLFILSGALLFVVFLLLVMVPRFASIYQDFQAPLPICTQILIQISSFLQNSGLWLLLILTTFIAGLRFLFNQNTTFASHIERYLLHFPLIGKVRQKIAITRFAHTLAITHESGLPILNALDAAAMGCGHRIYATIIKQIKTRICEGKSLTQAMSSYNLFPKFVLQLVNIGEETGRLSEMLYQIVQQYEADLTHLFETFDGILEPIIMAVLGTVVGVLIIALYLPIINLGALV